MTKTFNQLRILDSYVP